ncbi:MAG: hypothetical protein QOE86_4670, partial [Solirubrobacteraceae bacterium]|nr:hypothetical protein [Solirubrobacteraceae bacterium]
ADTRKYPGGVRIAQAPDPVTPP